MSLSNTEDQHNEASYPTSAEENQSPRVKGLCSQTILLQELLLALSSRANVLIAAINLDYQFTYFNQAYVDEVERLVGIKLQIGMTVMDVYRDSPEQLAIAIKQWGRSLGGEPFIDVVKFLRSETSENFYEVTNSPMKNAQGIITLLIKYCPPHMCYYPDIKNKLSEKGIPELLIEVEHEVVSFEQIKTRLQTFAEIIQGV